MSLNNLKPGKEHKPMTKGKEFAILNLGTLLLTLGVYFFKIPNNFVMGGVTGIAVVFSNVFPQISATDFIFILNMVLLAIGFLVFGKNFGLKTVYASVLMSISLKILEIIFPLAQPLTDSLFLELIFAMLLPGIGSALLFYVGASSGGTDIVAMIMRKFANVDIGKALLMSDLVFTLSTFFIFNPKTALSSLLGLFAKSIIVDDTIEQANQSKMFFIFTDQPDKVIDFVSVYLHRGGSMFKGKGIYSGHEKTMITVVCNGYESALLQEFLDTRDPKGFVTIVNTSQIIGKGFHYVH